LPLALPDGFPLNAANQEEREIIVKKFLMSAAICLFALTMAHAVAIFTPVGPATFKVSAIVRDLPFQLIGGKTNQSATSTNTTQVFKATILETPFGNTNMLALLANSFDTNFPAGSQMGMRLGNLFVVDSTGTNIIFTPTGVISFQFEEEFVPANETQITTENASGTQFAGSLSETIIGSVTMNYDDTLNTTADGTHTKFAFKGFYTLKLSENLKTHAVKSTTEFQGTGGGTVRDVPTILTGTISGKAAGVVPVF
jgi:hypothetical protein